MTRDLKKPNKSWDYTARPVGEIEMYGMEGAPADMLTSENMQQETSLRFLEDIDHGHHGQDMSNRERGTRKNAFIHRYERSGRSEFDQAPLDDRKPRASFRPTSTSSESHEDAGVHGYQWNDSFGSFDDHNERRNPHAWSGFGRGAHRGRGAFSHGSNHGSNTRRPSATGLASDNHGNVDHHGPLRRVGRDSYNRSRFDQDRHQGSPRSSTDHFRSSTPVESIEETMSSDIYRRDSKLEQRPIWSSNPQRTTVDRSASVETPSFMHPERARLMSPSKEVFMGFAMTLEKHEPNQIVASEDSARVAVKGAATRLSPKNSPSRQLGMPTSRSMSPRPEQTAPPTAVRGLSAEDGHQWAPGVGR
ncbi:hypothetical protein BKA63DRAFT_568164 [Paraphoma chrysanthemicola]|nr:hypothetical protein BKA63DRAFT_568164 [Paraphoma chrysanthemicola]